MNVVLRISVIAFGLALIFLAAAWVFLFKTTPGKLLLFNQIESYASRFADRQFSSTISFGSLEGSLPDSLQLNDIKLIHEEEVWFETGQLKLSWIPLALLSRKTIIDELEIVQAKLYSMPPAAKAIKTENNGSIFDRALPWIEVRAITVEQFRVSEGLLGREREMSLFGYFSTENKRIESDLALKTADDSDTIKSLVKLEGQNLSIDLSLASAEGGMLAWILREDQPVSFSVTGTGPARTWSGTIKSKSQAFGQIRANILADLTRLSQLSVEGIYQPGAQLSAEVQSAMGDSLQFLVELVEVEGKFDLAIEEISGEFGFLSGTVSGVRLSSEQKELNLDLVTLLTDKFADTIRLPQFSGESTVEGTIRHSQDILTGNIFLSTPVFDSRITEFRSSRDGDFVADIEVAIENSPIDEPNLVRLLDQGATVRASVARKGSEISWEDLAVSTNARPDNPGLTIAGQGKYDVDARELTFGGDAIVQPNLISGYLPLIAFSEPVQLSYNLEGPIDFLSVDLSSAFGLVTYDQRATFAPGNLQAKLTGMPFTPAGTIRLVSSADEYGLEATLASEADEKILVENISAFAFGAFLTGDIKTTPRTETLMASLDLDFQEGASLPNGLSFQGSGAISLDIAGKDISPRPVMMIIETDQLRSDSFGVEQMRLSADGFLSEFDVSVSGQGLTLPGDAYAAAFEARAELLREADVTDIVIRTFSAGDDLEFGERLIKLSEPARVTSREDMITLDALNLNIFGESSVQASGSTSPEKVILTAKGTDLKLPNLLSPISFDLTVDTSSQEAGRLTASGVSTDQNDMNHVLQVESLWEGDTLSTIATLTDESGNQSGQLSLQNPLRLVRSDRLSLNYLEGDLKGRFTYDDQLIALLSFLPVDTDFIEAGVEADVFIGGTVSAPDISGGIRLKNGRYEERNSGAQVSDIEGQLDFSFSANGSEGTFRATASDALGNPQTVDLSGSVFLGQQASGDLSVINGKLVLNRATLIDSPELTAEVTSDLDLTGSLSDLLLAGRVDIQKLSAVIPTTEQKKTYVPVRVVRVDDGGEVISAQTGRDQRLLDLEFDVLIAAKDEIFISGRGVQSEWQGELKVTGPSTSPVLNGSVQSVNGRLDFAGRQFDISRGRLLFSEERGLSPDLDIIADYSVQTDQGNVQATITISGSSQSPQVRITSTPVLPQEDLMALILFGKAPSQLSAFESLRIADAVAQLSGQGFFNGGAGLTGQLASAFGLDALNFGQDVDTGTGTVSIGKYVSDDIYVSATQGIGTKGSVSITYDINDKVSVETTLEQDGTQSVSANYKRDY